MGREKELIKDKRLTPTMSRSRSGRTQIFTEKGNDSLKIELKHGKKSMYAELINGKWYWVEGCAECKGEPRDWMTYLECELHDRCRTCDTPRKELKETPWGGKNGWQCRPCHDKDKAATRRNAFLKLGGEDPDCTYCDDIICPHCGTKQSSDEIYENQDLKCYLCEGEMHLEVDYSASYTTSIKGKRVTN